MRHLEELWAEWVARGLDDELYWNLTLAEAQAVLEAWDELEYERRQHIALSAALVASTIANIHRKKGRKAIQPSDFIKDRRVKRALQASDLTKFAEGYRH